MRLFVEKLSNTHLPTLKQLIQESVKHAARAGKGKHGVKSAQ